MGDPLLHCVLFRRRADVGDKALFALYGEFAVFVDGFEGASDFRAGPNESPEGFHHGFRDGFVIGFDSPEARDRYLADPVHAQLGARLVAMIEGGTDGLLVFDMAL
ncbi:MAG: Dabb family protein [Oricola sp.]